MIGEKSVLETIFYNSIYYFEILNNYIEEVPSKLTLEDVLNLKEGNIFYYNYGNQKISYKCAFIKLTTKYYDNKENNDPQRLLIKFINNYREKTSYLTDCGVIPYLKNEYPSFKNTNYYNPSNCLTLKPLYRVTQD